MEEIPSWKSKLRSTKGILLVKIPEDIKEAFRKLCKSHSTSMEDVLQKLIKQAVYARPIGKDLFPGDKNGQNKTSKRKRSQDKPTGS